MKLKECIKNWLFKDELDKLNRCYESVNMLIGVADSMKQATDKYNNSCKEYEKAKSLCKQSTRVNEELKTLYNEITDVAVDVGFKGNDHSWAVVCVAGKPEYVKFLPLNNCDTRQIIDFLKHFSRSNNIIDSPFAFRSMLNHEIVKDMWF